MIITGHLNHMKFLFNDLHLKKNKDILEKLFDKDVKSMPVYGTIASQFNDPGIKRLLMMLIIILLCSLENLVKSPS